MSDQDQDTGEESGMAGTFVDEIADTAAHELGELRNGITASAALLEQDPHYRRAWTFVLAAEAVLEHALREIADRKAGKRITWQAHQREATAFLESRDAASGHLFMVKGHPGRQYPGLPREGRVFRFHLIKARALGTGNPYRATVAKIEVLRHGAVVATADQVPLQALHRAFLAGDVVDVTDGIPGDLFEPENQIQGTLGPLLPPPAPGVQTEYFGAGYTREEFERDQKGQTGEELARRDGGAS
jgi:hypothetical protein